MMWQKHYFTNKKIYTEYCISSIFLAVAITLIEFKQKIFECFRLAGIPKEISFSSNCAEYNQIQDMAEENNTSPGKVVSVKAL